MTLKGLRGDWFDDREGLALLGAALIVVLALLVIFTASRLERVRRRELAIIAPPSMRSSRSTPRAACAS